MKKRTVLLDLTTLKDRHVTFNGSAVTFSFKGKKGISHNIELKSKRLAKVIKKCRDVPGKEFFNIMMMKASIIPLIQEW